MLGISAIVIGLITGPLPVHASSQFCRVSEGLPVIRLKRWAEGHANEASSFQLLLASLRIWKKDGHHFYSSTEHESQLGNLQIRQLLKKTGIFLDIGSITIVDFAKAKVLYAQVAQQQTSDPAVQLQSLDEFIEDLKWVLLARTTDREKILVKNHLLSEELHAQVAHSLQGKLNRQLYPKERYTLRNPVFAEAADEFSTVSKAVVTEYLAQIEVLLGILRQFHYQNQPPAQIRTWAHHAHDALKVEFELLFDALMEAKPRRIRKDRMNLYIIVAQKEYQLEQLIP